MRIIILIVYVMHSAMAGAQCFEKNTAFKDGESIVYKAIYNWGFIWVDAGMVHFDVIRKNYKDQDVYHLRSFGTSLPKHDWFFKVRDYYEAYLNVNTLKPIEFTRDTYERGFEIDNHYWFDYDKNKIYTSSQSTEKPIVRNTFDLKACTFDLISAIYYCRNLDFSTVRINEKIPISLIVDNELVDIYIRYLGKETITTPYDKTWDCIKFSALLMEGTMFNGGEDIFVWVTNDSNKIPVMVEAKILVGSVKAILQSAKGLRHPMIQKVVD